MMATSIVRKALVYIHAARGICGVDYKSRVTGACIAPWVVGADLLTASVVCFAFIDIYTGAVTYSRVSRVASAVVASFCVDTILVTTRRVQNAFIYISAR